MFKSCESSFAEAFREPLTVAHLMNDFPHSWCIASGWAIDLFVNRISRLHKDVDIAIWRSDQLALRTKEDAIVPLKSVPILAPEIVLLYKAKNASNQKNQSNFEVALPHLNDVQRTWLKTALSKVHPEHEWIDKL